VAAISSFDDLKLNKQLLKAIADAGYEKPTEIQMKCVPLIMGGQEVIGIAQTGTGKTAAYLLPILMKLKYAQGSEPRALILVPTKELVLQVTNHAQQLATHSDLRVAGIYGGVGPKPQIESIERGVDLLIATPGRFLEIYQRNALPCKQMKTVVLDEADRVMDMGFLPQLKKIFEVLPPKRQNLLFSATFSERVEILSRDFLTFPTKVEVTRQATPARQVEQEWYSVANLKTKINFLEYLL
jgi:ATP-dependent RNA helicase RhlE